ncbi:MAG: Transcriptional regulator of heat shock protein [Candidatus Levybacteria bacterium GW2011_GWA1_37_16]|nr:MAG: Transcriptional regulator of heat shock protein [Candidatus Levybacteria bacterium GW2011_GWA1_37_16]
MRGKDMHDLTQRQVEILKALIEEYIATAEPVGSETLEKKYSLSASPATIRNEMVSLTRLGYLKKNHTSAGRAPTPMGMKFYVKQLMKEKDLSVTEETAVKESLWDYREKEDKFLRKMTKSLADKTKALAIATTSDGSVYYAGYANILEMPEFFDIDVMKSLLSTMDEFEDCRKFFADIVSEDVQVLLGDELGPDMQGPYGFVFTHYKTPMQLTGEIGVLGPSRLNYTQIVPTVRYFGNLIEEIAKGW